MGPCYETRLQSNREVLTGPESNRLGIAGVIIVAFLVTGCSPPGIDRTSAADSLLVAVLSDLYLVEADLQLASVEMPDSAIVLGAVHRAGSGRLRRDSVLTAHGLTEALLNEEMRGYLEQPEELQKLYDRILDRLNLERQQLQVP